jgi:integrase
MARRGKHEGSISQRKDGRWEARITLSDGKRKSFYGQNRKDVAARLRDALADQAKHLPIVPEKITLAQHLERWLKTSSGRTDPPTQERYASQVRLYINPALGHIKLAQLDAPRLQAFYDDLGKKLSPASIRGIHSVIHQALKQAVRQRLLQRNVSDDVDLPLAEDSEIEPYTEEEANRFLEASVGHREEALFVLAITTGMRQGELLGLQWKNIDWDAGDLHVEQQARRILDQETGKRVSRMARPKTKKARTIALSQVALDALRAHQIRQKAERIAVGPDWQNSGLAFPDEWGKPMNRTTVYHRFKALLKAKGLPERRFHDLRHTAATILLTRGVNVKQVSEMLGHADITMTLRVYGHLLPIMHRAAAEMMDQVFERKRA